MSKNALQLELFLSVFRNMVASREIDILEQDYTQRGEAFFHVSGTGHENIAFLNTHLIPADYLHCHYRDKSLMLARGLSIEQFFLSLFCKDNSHSRGRQMSAHLSDPDLHIMSLVGPVGNNALQAVGAASAIKNQSQNPIVLCGLGDGTSQQGEVLEAIAHAVRQTLPVLFVIQDNTWAISTKTEGQTFYNTPDGDAEQYYGIPIVRVDGKDAHSCHDVFGEVVASMRKTRKPAIIIFKVARINSHTNADDHRMYRSAEEIEATRASGDPLVPLEAWFQTQGIASQDLSAIRQEIKETVRKAAEAAQYSPEPKAIYDAKAVLPASLFDLARENRGDEAQGQVVMLEALRVTLKNHLESDADVCLFGEDIEDPKGDVFGVTRGLSQAFPDRVVNSPLAEATIVGVAVGQALAGKKPVAFLQFADFFPIAFNQIFAELGSMHWRTDGAWKCPVILMVTCGGYKPGLGPFHASSMESIAVHTPGVDVFMPSSAADAAGLLNAAFESKRPTVFFYPKSCLNDRSQATSTDIHKRFVPIGKARLVRSGSDFTFVGWGNTVALCRQAADELSKVGINSDVIDLRSLFPWDQETVLSSVKRSRRMIIAQEDSHSASLASEISATISELIVGEIVVKRVSRPDTYVPCNFGNQLEVLPSYQKILETAVEILGASISWQKDQVAEDGYAFIEAAGSSPSDESVTVIQWRVKPGDVLKPGMPLAEMEADKAAFELSCPIGGTLTQVLVPVGMMVKVGTPLLVVAIEGRKPVIKPLTRENPGIPTIVLPEIQKSKSIVSDHHELHESGRYNRPKFSRAMPVAGIAGIVAVPGSIAVSNTQIASKSSDWDAQDIFKRIGIESRYWVAESETTTSLAIKAAQKLLKAHKLKASDLSAVICTTGTPDIMTPSLACLVLDALSKDLKESPLIPAWDINAACSGYLYGLQAAWDHLLHEPSGKVLLVSSEVLSRKTDPVDSSTAPIFGDAATATLILGWDNFKQFKWLIERPVLAAKAESGKALSVPLKTGEYVHMDGPKVFQEAVRHMVLLLEKACAQSGIKVSDLDLVVPHQANQRIINAVRQKAKLDEDQVYSNIRHYGNTSSSSIPIALAKILDEGHQAKSIGLCAFGGGFTFAGGILRVPDQQNANFASQEE